MVAKQPVVNLEQGMQKGLFNNQSSGLTACARQIITLAGLVVDSSYNNRVRKFSNQFSLSSKAITIETVKFLRNKRSSFIAILTMSDGCSFLA